MGHVASATVWPGVPHLFQIININLRYTSDKNWTTRSQLNSQCSNKKTGYPNSWYFFRLWLRKARVEWATLPCCSVTMATPKWHHVLVNPYRPPGDIARWHHSLSVGNASRHCIPTYIFPKYLPQKVQFVLNLAQYLLFRHGNLWIEAKLYAVFKVHLGISKQCCGNVMLHFWNILGHASNLALFVPSKH